MTLVHSLDRQWVFRRVDPPGPPPVGWTEVELPHTPFLCDLDGRNHWFGMCEYRRSVQLPPGAPTGRIALYVGAAMHSVTVLLDDREVGRHEGGYLPFELDLTAKLRDGRAHALALRLDNRDNPDVPPGKPYADLDFCWYGGLYREVELRCYPALHITDAVAAGQVAGGGVFVRTLALGDAAATVGVRVHVHNAATHVQAFSVEVELLHAGTRVADARRDHLRLAPGTGLHADLSLEVARPKLWSPDAPALHTARVTVRDPDGAVVDERTVRFGIRRIAFSRSGGFVLNGRRLRPRGTNRHQDYPHAGYAVPRAAQRRDARRIKEAGFDYVRLSHYPQSPAFLDACDELGLLVTNAIPGWQILGGDWFREACFRNAREVIRRDRNHPCVVLWELSLNETAMDEEFMARLHAIGHEEYPGDQLFTAGWIDRYDVYLHSRQHGQIHRWQNGDKALVIAEYGDWEFYAANEGFDQRTGAGVFAAWSHGRQRRRDGERGLRQQVENHVIALNDTLGSPAACDGQWSMFDYPRGYDPQRAACGVMDIHRLPKFSWHFYRSQRDATADGGADWRGGPVVFIASHWTPASDLRVLVFSNCDEVELSCNGRPLGRRRPGRAWMTQYLPHPPFRFDLPAFAPGALEATGYIGGRAVATHRVATPGAPARLEVEIDTAGVTAAAGEPDLLLAHARLVDADGNLCVGESRSIDLVAKGAAERLAPPSVEAGVASIVLRLPDAGRAFTLRAACPDLPDIPPATLEWPGIAGATKPVPAKAKSARRAASVVAAAG